MPKLTPAETTDQIDNARATYAALLESSLKRVVTVLSGLEGVKRISLVGSYARGRADLFTDLDILVAMDTDLSFIDRLRMLYPERNEGISGSHYLCKGQ